MLCFACASLILISPLLILLLLRLCCRLTVGRYSSHQDMTGKTVLITGASAGIGKATAFDLARRNARVLLACRNLEKAERVKREIISATGNENVEVKLLDLESFDSVRNCANDVLRTEKRLDVLINNAGTASDFCISKDGYETNLQTNYLGHFLLTLLLLDLLKKSKSSRIINVSSLTYLLAVFDFDDLKGTKQNSFLKYIGNFYYRSKLANIWFTKELAKRLEGTGVTVNALHPGLIQTDLLNKFEHPNLTIYIYRIFLLFLAKNTEEGAQTSIYLAVDPQVENTTGKFFYDCKERILVGQARSRKNAKKLFEISEEIVGEKFKV